MEKHVDQALANTFVGVFCSELEESTYSGLLGPSRAQGSTVPEGEMMPPMDQSIPVVTTGLLAMTLAVAACSPSAGKGGAGGGPASGGVGGDETGGRGGGAGGVAATGGGGGGGGAGGMVDNTGGGGGSPGGAGSTPGGSGGGGGNVVDASGSGGNGAGGEAGRPDATVSAGDGGRPTGGPSLCTPGRFLLCEGFEGTPVGDNAPAGWTRRGNTSIADDQAARGAHALKIAPAANGERRLYFADAESFGAGHWGRIFYRVQLPVPQPFVHSTLVTLQGSGPSVGPAEFRVVDTVKNAGANASHQFLWNVQPQGAEYGKGSPYLWRFDGNWHCAEWHVDSGTQTYEFFFDGTEVQQIRIQNGAGNFGTGSNRTNIPPVFTDLKVGWNNYQAAAPGFVAWIDEIAVDTARVGCDR